MGTRDSDARSPSNLGISSFILCVVVGTGVELEGMGMEWAMEGETGVRRVRMSSSFRDMVCMVSPKRARTSARWGGLGESAMDGNQREHQLL